MYLRAITSTNFLGVFTYKMAAKATGIGTERNYITFTLCIHKTTYRVGKKSKLVYCDGYFKG